MISAVPMEGQAFAGRLKLQRTSQLSRSVFYSGKIDGKSVVYTVAGMGKTNAARALASLIEHYSPLLVINFGIGGAYPASGLNVGDLAVATEEIYADEGVVLADGFHPLETIGIPFLKTKRRTYYNAFPLDRKLSMTAFAASRDIANSRAGTFVTVSSCSGTTQTARIREKKFNALCENMEGAAVAHVCCFYGIPCVEIRGISNIVQKRDVKKWDIHLAATSCQSAVSEFLYALDVRQLRARKR